MWLGSFGHMALGPSHFALCLVACSIFHRLLTTNEPFSSLVLPSCSMIQSVQTLRVVVLLVERLEGADESCDTNVSAYIPGISHVWSFTRLEFHVMVIYMDEYTPQTFTRFFQSCISMPSPNELDAEPTEDAVRFIAFAEAVHDRAFAEAFFEFVLCILGSLVLILWHQN